ncbi:MAG: preprotein translocase subunit SecA [Rhodospirillales bacterium]|nr:preprotein translocase subunit SecA [Rhodospirillales bacterium]MCB9995890.1 preprotein translocase subunit SecA [Rhodospirillales bacterium]
MLLTLATKIFGSSNDRVLKGLYRHIEPINALEPKYEAMNDSELAGQTAEFRQRLEKGESLDDLMHEAFAVVREAAKRTLGQRHYDVQLVGGLALHQGKIAEMKTGEGKTLVATLAVYLNALSGKGVHVVTVNDYLAQRDAEWMGQVYRFLGLTVGCITGNVEDGDRKAAYAADITYGTNNEFGFDYLRDNMKYQLDNMVQRDFNFAIVDEVDSILIDEARTPLIISGPSESFSGLYQEVNKIIPFLDEKDFDLDEKMRTVTFTDNGTEHIEDLLREHQILTDGALYDANNIALVHHVNQALRAHKLFFLDKDYIVKDGKVIIIDEFTGRMMEGRRFSDGLHQALEAKEGTDIQNENQTLASITFQNYFRMYPKLAGMTGTAMTEATEFADIYNLGVIEIPTNVPVSRIDVDDKIFKSLAEKEAAALKIIKDCRKREQPVLVGTTSIEKSENLSELLKKNKIPHNVLNARYHEQEAFIIAQAGQPGAVTIATNMAGRGTDIQLGGNVEMRIKAEIDESLSEDKQKKAAEKIRAEVKENQEKVRAAGGLYVIGTERHESRRIDNQLRGRSGRQGDPGETVFFLSLEDDLMRIFGSEKMEMLLAHKHIGLRDGEALTHPWISKTLERAQAKVEAMNFDVRKNLLKFDNVMNDQRKVIYDQRRELMAADDVEEFVDDMRHTVIEDLVHRCIPPRTYAEQWDVETLKSEAQRLLNLDLPLDEWAKEEGIAETEIVERLLDESDRKMAQKAANTGPDLYRKLQKGLVLQKLDQHWKEHLLNLDHLRQGINLRAFAQRDPLNEYKAEAFAMFEMMLDHLRESVTEMLSLVEFNVDPDAKSLMFRRGGGQTHETRQDPALVGAPVEKTANFKAANVQPFPERLAFDENNPETWGKVQRNAACPCGSGKKFKHCHGKVTA